MRIDKSFVDKIEKAESKTMVFVRHVQGDSVVALFGDYLAAEADASKRNTSAQEHGLVATYDVVNASPE